MRGSRLTRWLAAFAVLMGSLWVGGCRLFRGGPTKDQTADKLYFNGTVVTMNQSGTVAECVATKGDTITCVENGDTCCKQVRGKDTEIIDLEGATVLPGFIDSHSHMAGYGLLNDPDHWIDVSSVNVLLKPPPGDPRCTTPDDYQRCFIPVKNQDEVVERLKRGLPAAADAGFMPILGFNYDPSRLGHSKGCKGNGVGFQCQNFEDGTALAQLNKISTTRPILIDSESGHITYVNGKALADLGICTSASARAKGDAGCRMPINNPKQEEALAKLGQLDEDLSFAATDKMVATILGADAVSGTIQAIHRAAATYSANGFTTVQEGTTSPGLMLAYQVASLDEEKFKVTARVLLYDPSTNDLGPMVKKVPELKVLQNKSLQIAGMKAFADGSTQGFTAFLTKPYAHVWTPFNLPGIFTQPYKGLPDVDTDGLAADFLNAHKAGLPLMVHQNGDAAIADVLAALPQPEAGTPPPRDLMIHFAMATPDDLKTVGGRGIGVTFLTPDLYFYGQPMCRQILGPERTAQLYPAADAVKAGMRFGIHSDTPVTPPVPLFMIWTAKTRKTQMMPWYEADAGTGGADGGCPEVMGPEQAITIEQGIKAFTIDAAWLYGLESTLGSIEVGKTADMVELSDNPLSMESDPDRLKTIRVLGTVHQGHRHPNPDAQLPPIWPG